MKFNFPIPLNDLKFVVKRTGCMGFCPVYELVINGNGSVKYIGTDFVEVSGEISTTIDKSKVLTLFKQALELGFFELESEYSIESLLVINDEHIDCIIDHYTCLPSVTIEVQVGDYIKSVWAYQGAPDRFYKYLKVLDKLSGASKWIGNTKV